MRIVLPSAIIAFACHASLAHAGDDGPANDSGVATNAVRSRVAQDMNAAYRDQRSNDECNKYSSKGVVTEKDSGAGVDVGILGCLSNQTCQRDATSSIGGRCMENPTEPIFPKRRDKLAEKRRATRSLQQGEVEEEEEDEPFVCPRNCPKAFCDCAQDDGDAFKCADELHDVCTANRVGACVPDEYLVFYQDTYCTFAECIIEDNRPYPECACEYYQSYCDIYYETLESLDECVVSTCCQGSDAENKFACLPALAPTYSPTLNPTLSFMPSASPTVSFLLDWFLRLIARGTITSCTFQLY